MLCFWYLRDQIWARPWISTCQYFEFTQSKQAQQGLPIQPDQAKLKSVLDELRLMWIILCSIRISLITFWCTIMITKFNYIIQFYFLTQNLLGYRIYLLPFFMWPERLLTSQASHWHYIYVTWTELTDNKNLDMMQLCTGQHLQCCIQRWKIQI